MAPRKMTCDLAYAAARDAGNRSMRAGGRKVWSREDYDAAADELRRLWPKPTEDDGREDNERR